MASDLAVAAMFAGLAVIGAFIGRAIYKQLSKPDRFDIF
jgi:hypothetical protein